MFFWHWVDGRIAEGVAGGGSMFIGTATALSLAGNASASGTLG